MTMIRKNSFFLFVTLFISLFLVITTHVNAVQFAVIGDYGTAFDPERDEEGKVASIVTSWDGNQDLIVVTVGDNNYPDGGQATIDINIGQFYHQFLGNYQGSYGPGSVTNRFFPALGNHDWDTNANGLPYVYTNYFSLPGNERYYAVLQGPVELFIIDSDPREPDGNTVNSTQAAWLQNALANSTAAWQFVFMHHAPYSSGSIHGSVPGMQWPYAAWGADAVFAGHDHVYERLDIDNIPYFVNGVGGDPTNPFSTPVEGSQVRYNADNGAMLVTATELSATFEFYNTQYQLVDSLTVTKGASDPAIIPNSNWQLKYVDSEETVFEDGAAINAFDNDINTFWHSKWGDGSDPLPHEIQIDLVDVYDISGFRYQPRVDGYSNGRIAQYEFYTSLDGVNWGTPVAEGAFPNSTSQKEVTFSESTARYIRLVALTEVNGNPWTTVAELILLGDVSGNSTPSIYPINDQQFYEGTTQTVDIQSIDPDGPSPIISADLSSLPADANADFTDFGDGNALFTWTPVTGDASATPYSISITATDQQDAALFDVENFNITVSVPPQPSITQQIKTKSDDAEETPNGKVFLNSTTLDLVQDGRNNLLVGLRFTDIQIPNSATITSAKLEFQAAESNTGSINLNIHAEAAANANTFINKKRNISSRSLFANNIAWNAEEDWTTGETHQSPDISLLIQQVVNQGNWNSGNSLSLIISGSSQGKRTATSFNGSSNGAPKLIVEYDEN